MLRMVLSKLLVKTKRAEGTVFEPFLPFED
jgi:hypothetical protein